MKASWLARRAPWSFFATPISGTRSAACRGLRSRHSSLAQPNGNSSPFEVGDQLVDVGNGHHEGDRLAVKFGDPDQILDR